MTKLKVLIVGFGGVGIIGGYTLELNGKAEVTALVRSDYDIVSQEGYNIESVDYGTINGYKPSNIANSIEGCKSFGPFDFILVTTKNLPDVYKVEDIIEDCVIPKRTVIVLSQNGIGIEKSMIERFPDNIVLSAVSMISSNKFKTTVKHVSTDALSIGFFKNPNFSEDAQKEAADDFIKLYANNTNECSYDKDVNFSRWRKLVYNATFNSICTLTGIDSGRLEIFGGVDTIIRKCMGEILEIAKSDGAELPSDIIETMIHADDGIWCTPSMLVDLRKGNFIEVEVIAGNPVRIAQKNSVSAPYLTMAYELLKVIQSRTKESKGLITVPKERPVKV